MQKRCALYLYYPQRGIITELTVSELQLSIYKNYLRSLRYVEYSLSSVIINFQDHTRNRVTTSRAGSN